VQHKTNGHQGLATIIVTVKFYDTGRITLQNCDALSTKF